MSVSSPHQLQDLTSMKGENCNLKSHLSGRSRRPCLVGLSEKDRTIRCSEDAKIVAVLM